MQGEAALPDSRASKVITGLAAASSPPRPTRPATLSKSKPSAGSSDFPCGNVYT